MHRKISNLTTVIRNASRWKMAFGGIFLGERFIFTFGAVWTKSLGI
jgi:hypothetical protein